MAFLVFERGGSEVLRIALAQARTVIGRGGECEVLLPDPGISRNACTILQVDGGWELAEVGASPVTVNGKKVTRNTSLKDGSEIQVGPYRITFRADAANSSVDETRVPLREATRILAVKSDGQRVVYEEAALFVEAGPDAGKSFTLRREVNVVGKDVDCDVPLTDAYISQQHCRFEQSGAGWRLVDLGSTNGTRVNGVRVNEGTLPPDARVELGQTTMILKTAAKERAVEPAEVNSFHGLVGSSRPMRAVYSLLQAAATTDAPVLLLGPSGSGKELAARALHDASHRAAGPFIAINCGGLSPNLVESEFFGHEKGAFTGADKRRIGAFERCAGGTLFLDELGELAGDLQAKLLRVLETGDFQRVGGNETMHTDARIVAATHRDLAEMVAAGTFREDLFYRMAVVPVRLPPLADRKSDIPMIAEHLLTNMAPGVPPTLTAAAVVSLQAHDWPGNVRELRNVLQRALLFAREGEVDARHLALDPLDPGVAPDVVDEGVPRPSMEESERATILAALKKHNGNKKAAAKELGIARSTLHNKLKKYGIE